MPKISIYEKDLTSIAPNELVDNIAYIPGYANAGPINTPVVVKTLSEFQAIFGTMPYSFRNSQSFPTGYSVGNYALAGTYEKSYIYATELLNKGLPVLFERVMKADNIDGWTSQCVLEFTDGEEVTSTFILKSKNPGVAYLGLGCTLSVASNLYTLNVYYNETRVEKIQFSFDVSSADYFAKKTSDYVVFPEPGETLPTSLDVIVSEKAFTFISTDNDNAFAVASVQPTSTTFIANKYYKLEDNVYILVNTYDAEVVSYYVLVDEFTVTDIYDIMTGFGTTVSIFEKLTDRDDYDIKFITTGSYPVYDLTKSLVLSEDDYGSSTVYYDEPTNLTELIAATAGTRGDSLALIDYNNYDSSGDATEILDIWDDLQVDDGLYQLQVGSSVKAEYANKYASLSAPWGTYSTSVLLTNTILPASFGYLMSYANSIQNNPSYLAIAGITRGLVPNFLQPSENITGAKSNALQAGEISINPITYVNPYGYCIWGNRTLNKNEDAELVASSFLNVRILTNDVKKLVYRTSKSLTFENDTELLWLNFKSNIEPDLNKMVSGNGLTNYKILRRTTTERATLKAVVRLYVVEAVEDFDIDIELADSYITIQ